MQTLVIVELLFATIIYAEQIRYCHLGNENRTVTRYIARYALASLLEKRILPNDTTIRYVGGNISICDDYLPLGAVTQTYLSTNADFDFIIGPYCSQGMDPVGKMAVYWNIPLIGYISTADYLANKVMYKTLGRVSSTQKYAGQALKYYMNANKWHRAALVKFPSISYACNLVGAALGAVDDGSNLQIRIVYQVELSSTAPDSLTEVFEQIRERARVILLCMVYKTALDANLNTRDFMIKAKQMNMTGSDYVYLLTLGGRSSLIRQLPWEAPEVPDQMDNLAKEAFQAAIMVEPIGSELKRFQNLDKILLEGLNTSLYDPLQIFAWTLIYFHDGVYLYGLAANRTYQNGAFYFNDGLKIFQGMQCQKFTGLTGLVEMDKYAERIPAYTLSAIAANGDFSELGTLTPQHYTNCQNEEPTSLAYVYTSSREAYWRTADNKPPPDSPICGFFDERCQPDYTCKNSRMPVHRNSSQFPLPQSTSGMAILGVIIFGVVLFVVLVTAISLLVWWRKKQQYEYELFSKAWAINPARLQIWNLDRPMMGSVANFAVFGGSSTISSDSKSSTSQTSNKQGADMFTTARDGNFGVSEPYSGAGIYEGQPVSVEMLPKLRSIALKRADLVQLKKVRDLQNDNLNIFIGANFEEDRTVTILWRRGARGNLEDVLYNDDIQLDMMFKASMIKDIIKGLEYLHKSPIGVHGNLVAENCVVDGRWVVKLTNFGLDTVIDTLMVNHQITPQQTRSNNLFHFAPEVLRARHIEGLLPRTTQADIYSFGMVLYEILTRETLFADSNLTDTDILHKIEAGDIGRPFRPNIPKTTSSETANRLLQLAKECWVEGPEDRPPIGMVKQTIYRETKNYSKNIMDHMVNMLEKYANNLEKIVDERTKELEEEKKRSDQLLVQLLPPSVAAALKQGHTVPPEIFESATIYFSDIVGFTSICGRSTPFQIVDMLNALYTAIDEIIGKHDAYKVETIGDAYLVASGIPARNGIKHAMHIADMALDIRKFIGDVFKVPHELDKRLQLRIGMHSGSVAAGVVGMIMPRYCLFGDTVNVASRMESTGLPMKIQISTATQNLLAHSIAKYTIELRGTVEVKGKGSQVTYWLNERGRKNSQSAAANTTIIAQL